MASVIHSTGHGLVAGDGFQFANILPDTSGIDEDVVYYVLAAGLTANAFTFSETVGGTPFVLTEAITSGSLVGIGAMATVSDGNMTPPPTPSTPSAPTLTSFVRNGVVSIKVAAPTITHAPVRSIEIAVSHIKVEPVLRQSKLLQKGSGDVSIAFDAPCVAGSLIVLFTWARSQASSLPAGWVTDQTRSATGSNPPYMAQAHLVSVGTTSSWAIVAQNNERAYLLMEWQNIGEPTALVSTDQTGVTNQTSNPTGGDFTIALHAVHSDVDADARRLHVISPATIVAESYALNPHDGPYGSVGYDYDTVLATAGADAVAFHSMGSLAGNYPLNGGSDWDRATVHNIPDNMVDRAFSFRALGGITYAVRQRVQDVYGNFSAWSSTASLTAVAGSDALQATNVPDGSITTAKLADGAVTTIKVTDANITMAKLAGTPGGELGGTWTSPTVDTAHAGDSGHAAVVAAHAALSDPHTGYVLESLIDAAGDLIVGTADNTVGRLAKGADNEVLTVDPVTHLLKWIAPSSGFSDPMTSRGDIIIRNASNVTARLAKGSSAQVLTSDGTDIAWATPTSGFSDPLTTRGDLIVRGAASTGRLALGASGYVLTSDGTDAAWAAAAGGSTDPTIPSGGTNYDGSSTSGWTGYGSPDTFDANSTVAGHLYLAKTTMGGNNLVVETRAVDSFPQTYTMKVGDMFLHANYHGVCLAVGETGGAGKFKTWGFVHENSANYLQTYAWNTISSSGASTNYQNSPGANFVTPPTWLRIVVTSSSDISFWHSWNGLIWYQIVGSVNPGFTIGIFGFGMYTFNAIAHKVAIDWIHKT